MHIAFTYDLGFLTAWQLSFQGKRAKWKSHASITWGELFKNVCLQAPEILISSTWDGPSYWYFYKLPRWFCVSRVKNHCSHEEYMKQKIRLLRCLLPAMVPQWFQKGSRGCSHAPWHSKACHRNEIRKMPEAVGSQVQFLQSSTAATRLLQIDGGWAQTPGVLPRLSCQGGKAELKNCSGTPGCPDLEVAVRWIKCQLAFAPSFLKISSLHLRNECSCFMIWLAAERSRKGWMLVS